MDWVKMVEARELREKSPVFSVGDTVKVHVKVREGEKERIQVFEGLVIARRGGGVNASFTVRKISDGVGVERIFPLHSPSIAKIEVVRRGAVRRSKIYYLSELKGKSARIREKRPAAGTKGRNAKVVPELEVPTPAPAAEPPAVS